ncbi:MAG: alpha/beta hydrolase-fold protein [Candidatus Zhuqueibacterota bacterium]
MLKLFILISAMHLFFNSCIGQEKAITITVTAADSVMPADDKIYITGNVKQLGNWQPDSVSLNKIGNSTWEITLKFQVGERLEYKFTRGSWQKEEVLPGGVVPGNKYLIVQSDQRVEHTIYNWRDFYHTRVGGMTGAVSYHENFPSQKLGNTRTLIVWTPPDYEQSTTRYPVLYMHDGQNVFDPATSFLGVDWQIDETVDSLIRRQRIEEIIVVGIYNTADRLLEYTDTEKGRAYMDFLVNEVKPFIDQNYRTKTDRDNTAIMGSSLGGLISFYLVWRFPDIFSKAACLSTSIYWNNGAMAREIEAYNGPKKDIKIYFDSSGAGREGLLLPFYHRINELLGAKGFQMGVDLEYFYDEKADHSEPSWAKRSWRPLEFMFGLK